MTPHLAAGSATRRHFLARAFAALAGGALVGRARRVEAAPLGGIFPFIGEIRIFGGSFAPNGWAKCEGQILSIAQNTALFSLLGTYYGGNGVTTFALPDLRGRAPMQVGQGPGLSPHDLGEVGGLETHTLNVTEMPNHTHAFRGSASNGLSDTPDGRVPARMPSAIPQYRAAADVNLGAAAVGTSGGGPPHNNLQPFIAVNYIIALQGIFPPRE